MLPLTAMLPVLALVVLASTNIANAQSWCGKGYLPNQTDIPAAPPSDSYFAQAFPPSDTGAGLAFSCTSRYSLYLSGNGASSSKGQILLDALWTSKSSLSASGTLETTIAVKLDDGSSVSLANGSIPYPSRGNILSFDLGALPAATKGKAFTLSCSAKLASNGSSTSNAARSISPSAWLDTIFQRRSQLDLRASQDDSNNTPSTYNTETQLRVMNPPASGAGTAVRIDYASGTLDVCTPGNEAGWKSLGIPYGWYTDYGLVKGNLTVLDDMKARGFNFVHLVPPYDNVSDGDADDIAALNKIFDKAEQVGIGMVYDLRWSYRNLTAVKLQADTFRNRTSLLTWYTADEPDGTEDPLDATLNAYNTLYEEDGYRPVALVLNCLDYQFTSYARGADILAEDAYPISNNKTFSTRYHTVVNSTFGNCGCDDCGPGIANLSDFSTRTELFGGRLEIMGSSQAEGKDVGAVKGRTPVWGVTQGFGSPDEFWPRSPTGAEYLSMSLGSIARGGRGIMPWQWSIATSEIQDAARTLAGYLSTLSSQITSTSSSNSGDEQLPPLPVYPAPAIRTPQAGLDVGAWKIASPARNGTQTLVLLANQGDGNGNYPKTEFDISIDGLAPDAAVRVLFDTAVPDAKDSAFAKNGAMKVGSGGLKGELDGLQVVALLVG